MKRRREKKRERPFGARSWREEKRRGGGQTNLRVFSVALSLSFESCKKGRESRVVVEGTWRERERER